MATIADILTRKFPGVLFSIEGDRYATLDWFAENTSPKPMESDIRVFSAEVDAAMVAEKDAGFQQGQLFDKPDALLTALEILASGDQARIAQLRQRLATIRTRRAPR